MRDELGGAERSVIDKSGLSGSQGQEGHDSSLSPSRHNASCGGLFPLATTILLIA